ncbi:MAG: phosphodiester glycosidase family protein [Betaproteobacteria bacterium]|nr:phosphodiester glycosidase family protein [Betaproteobacteria bacterium]
MHTSIRAVNPMRHRRSLGVVMLGLLLGSCSTMPPPVASIAPALNPAPNLLPLPYTVERFNLPGPVAGVLVKINLGDPRVKVEVALADNYDPDGDGPCVGRLDTTSQAARKGDFDIAINASFFAVPATRDFNSQKISYFAGNCGYPVGWHYSGGKLVAKPNSENIRSTMVVHRDGKISLLDALKELPADTLYAVSGNAMMLKEGKPTPPARDQARHPRSAVGLSPDARTLYIMAIDGRQEPYSRGVTLAELADVLIKFGAHNAINLDGGGSTALVIKDQGTGVYAVANQPSDTSSLKLPIRGERPVIDVVGIRIR